LKVSRAWTTGLTEAEASRINDTVVHATVLLDRLRVIIQTKQDLILREESSFSQYDTPNWEYRQAHLNGRKQELKELLDLIKLHP
jgi:hypothetical protein